MLTFKQALFSEVLRLHHEKFVCLVNAIQTTTSRQLKKIQNKTNSENSHRVFLIFKKEQENDGVGDISSLFKQTIRLTMSLE